MNGIIEEYLGSALNGQVTMGQMLIIGGAALLVISVFLSIIFAVSKVKYNPDKAKKESVVPAGKKAEQVTMKKVAPVQNSAVVQPKQQTPVQNGTVILPKQEPETPQYTERGTVILPKQQ